jgi:hypothetical protein
METPSALMSGMKHSSPGRFTRFFPALFDGEPPGVAAQSPMQINLPCR